MVRRSRSRCRFAVLALVAMAAALGASVLVLADSHGGRPWLAGGPAFGTSDLDSPLDQAPCSACLLRAQLEGSDLAVTGGWGVAEAAPEALSSFGTTVCGLLIGPALPARGPPAVPFLPA